MKENAILEKSKRFAVRIVKFCKYLCEEKKEYRISDQLFRSGTSIGANVSEAIVAQSTKEFIAKLNISLKEANESMYWIEILKEAEIISETEFKSINADCNEVKSLLVAIVKTMNSNKLKHPHNSKF